MLHRNDSFFWAASFDAREDFEEEDHMSFRDLSRAVTHDGVTTKIVVSSSDELNMFDPGALFI